ncbi:MAG: Undecaprenyl-phosphate 4-deoxy-4-formamido-L-arabinose transferase [Anaerolineae bacterium]|nr:Undecaprenyl-phosphate 4-deoxy-4-formamido-L-arabinose transferase [Anaerolineae bacterium]
MNVQMPAKNVGPDVSFIMPCYNEEEVVGYTIPRFVRAFEQAGYRLQLVAVDNGSRDRTGEILRELATEYPAVTPHRVELNQGYGFGLLSGIPLCTAPWVGMIPADGQVDAEDVVRLYEAVMVTDGRVLGKVRRRFRMDGLRRKVVSVTYNLFVRLLWPRLESLDVNGTPKLLRRDVLLLMELKSKNWLLDPEIMIKAHYMGIRVLEFNAFARMRGGGVSHVRVSTCYEFLKNLLIFRFSKEWRRAFQQATLASKSIKRPAEMAAPQTVINLSEAGSAFKTLAD